jgi:hypothetical protein
MSNYPIVPELLNRAWPSEFSGAWGNIFISKLNNLVFGLYFNDNNPDGTIVNDDLYLELPDAYISIKRNGEIYEVYVIPPLRRSKIAAMMCAWMRTNFLDQGIIVRAPKEMTDSAKKLYNYLSLTYNEEYNNPGPAPVFTVYSDFGGRSFIDVENKYYN